MLGLMMMAVTATQAAPPPMDARLRGDVRCLAVYAVGIEMMTTPEDKNIAGLGMIYYYARAEAKLNPAQLEAAIRSEALILEKQGEAEGKRCNSEFQQVGDRLIMLGKALGG